MKIAIDAHSIGSKAGGNETFYRQLVRGLAAESGDHQYHIFYTHAAALETMPRDPRFSVTRIPQNPIVRNGVALPRLLAALKPDVFHCQYIKPPLVRAPTVVTIHDLAHEHYPEHFHPLEGLRMRAMVRATAQRAEHILTVSHFAARDIAQTYRIAPEKITIAYQAPAAIFRPRDQQQCQQELTRRYNLQSPFILYVGRIQARKNLPRLVEAYALARREGIGAQLVIAGPPDWQAQQLLAKIKKLQLEEMVRLPGYVAHNDLPLFFCASEAFVFPSLFEGFGLPVVESMACGTPVITSHGSALEEVAGDAALLVDPNDVPSISKAIVRVLSDSNLRKELAGRGLRRSADFHPQELAHKALEAYALAIRAGQR